MFLKNIENMGMVCFTTAFPFDRAVLSTVGFRNESVSIDGLQIGPDLQQTVSARTQIESISILNRPPPLSEQTSVGCVLFQWPVLPIVAPPHLRLRWRVSGCDERVTGLGSQPSAVMA